jgi:hypothetical protein
MVAPEGAQPTPSAEDRYLRKRDARIRPESTSNGLHIVLGMSQLGG